MAEYNRRPREAISQLPHGEVQRKINKEAKYQNKRAKNISVPVEIDEKKDGIFGGLFKRKK